VASFAPLHPSFPDDDGGLVLSVPGLIVTIMGTFVCWATFCPKKYQNYWTFCTRAAAVPFVTVFLAVMTTQTTGSWPTWFMFSLALIITAFVLGYVYGSGTPSVFQKEEHDDIVQGEISPEDQTTTT